MSAIDINLNNFDAKLGQHNKMPGKHKADFRNTDHREFKDSYEFGFRTMGDALFDLRRECFEWDSPQNIELTIVCSARENQVLTALEIKLDHDDGESDANVINGGIGPDMIEVFVNIKNITRLHYDIRLFGTMA